MVSIVKTGHPSCPMIFGLPADVPCFADQSDERARGIPCTTLANLPFAQHLNARKSDDEREDSPYCCKHHTYNQRELFATIANVATFQTPGRNNTPDVLSELEASSGDSCDASFASSVEDQTICSHTPSESPPSSPCKSDRETS